MHARAVIVDIQPGKMDELITIYRDSIAPAAREQKGSKGAFLLTNPDTNKAISITMWETEEAMTGGEASGYYQEQLVKFKDVFTAPPVREGYEIAVSNYK